MRRRTMSLTPQMFDVGFMCSRMSTVDSGAGSGVRLVSGARSSTALPVVKASSRGRGGVAPGLMTSSGRGSGTAVQTYVVLAASRPGRP
jgi:hypothetical protein